MSGDVSPLFEWSMIHGATGDHQVTTKIATTKNCHLAWLSRSKRFLLALCGSVRLGEFFPKHPLIHSEWYHLLSEHNNNWRAGHRWNWNRATQPGKFKGQEAGIVAALQVHLGHKHALNASGFFHRIGIPTWNWNVDMHGPINSQVIETCRHMRLSLQHFQHFQH